MTQTSTHPAANPVDLDTEVERLRRENAALKATLASVEPDDGRLRARMRAEPDLGVGAAHYGSIVDHLVEGIVLQDQSGAILTSNPAAERILGLTPEQMAGRTSVDPRWRAVHEDGSAFPGQDHPAMVSLRTGEVVSGVIMGVHKPDGTLTWIRIHSQPLFRDGGELPCAVVASFSDITDLKESESRARESEARLEFALRSARMGTWTWDVRTGEVFWSEDVEAIFGIERGTFGRTYEAFIQLVHPEDRRSVLAHLNRALKGDGTDDYMIEHRILRSDDTVSWLEGFGQVTRDERGAPIRMGGTVTDISMRKALEEQLRHAQRMETVGRLAGGVAHDFNNLLTAIRGAAELASLDEEASEDVREALDFILEASDKAERLTRQLLTFARKRVFDMEAFDVRRLVNNTDRLLSRLLGEDIEIQTRVASSPMAVRGDHTQLEQLLINLALNARDAMPDGGVLRIDVESTFVDDRRGSLPTGQYALLRVGDDGAGIRDTDLPHIFEPYYTTKDGGSGLGLATCYGIVAQLGGRIDVESILGEGTCFSIYLPTTEEDAVDEQSARPSSPIAAHRGRVLLVEDDDMVRAVAEQGLRKHGYDVICAASGPEALARLGADPSTMDVLVTDVVMPKMTGYDVAATVRRYHPNLKVLFVSGYAEGVRAKSDTAGAFADAPFLPKPYTLADLATAVAAVLSS